MDSRTIVAVLKGYFGDSFTEAQARKHLKKAHLDPAMVKEALDIAQKEGLITSEK